MIRELKEKRKDLLLEDFLLIILFLFSIDFLDKAGVLLILFVVGFIFLNITNRIEYDKIMIVLLCFSIMYFLSLAIYENVGIDTVVKILIMPWLIYTFGYNYIGIQRKLTVTQFTYLITFGFFIHGMLNLLASISTFGFSLNNNFRQAQDFWQHRSISVTTAALYYSPYALLSAASLFLGKNRLVKIFSVVSIVLSMIATFNYQNRTLLLAMGICMGISIILYLRDANVNEETKKLFIVIIILFLSAIVLVFVFDIFGARTWLEGTSLANRVGDEKQDRTTIWISFITNNPWKYPLGGKKVVLYENKPYVHNLWLDTFRRAGIIPFVTLVLFTISSVKTFKRCIYELENENGKLLMVFMLGVFSLCMVEPIIEANPYFFYIPIVVTGAANGRLVSNFGNNNNK